MPEKTLKEKVESGKKWLKKCAFNTDPGLEALTALEARVEELEKERDMNRLDYLEAVYERDAEFCDSEMYGEMNYLRQKRTEVPDE